MNTENKVRRSNTDSAALIIANIEAQGVMPTFLTHRDVSVDHAVVLINAIEACLKNLGYDPEIVGPKIEEALKIKFFENRKIEKLEKEQRMVSFSSRSISFLLDEMRSLGLIKERYEKELFALEIEGHYSNGTGYLDRFDCNAFDKYFPNAGHGLVWYKGVPSLVISCQYKKKGYDAECVVVFQQRYIDDEILTVQSPNVGLIDVARWRAPAELDPKMLGSKEDKNEYYDNYKYSYAYGKIHQLLNTISIVR